MVTLSASRTSRSKYERRLMVTCKREQAKVYFAIRASKNQFALFRIPAPIITACVLMAACQRDHGYAVLASVFKVEGHATFHHSGPKSQTDEVLSSRSRLAASDIIELRDESTAALSLIPGIFIEVQPHTILKIEELRVSKDGNETADGMQSRSAIIRLQQGAIRARLPNHGAGRVRLRVKTGAGAVAAGRNSLFSLRVDGDSMRIVCVRGKVTWQTKPGSRPMLLPPGNFIDAKFDGNTPAESKSVSRNVEAESEADAIIGTSGFLDDLTAKERNELVPWRRQ